MLLDVAAASDGRLARRQLVGDLTEATSVAALETLIGAEHQGRSLPSKVAFVQAVKTQKSTPVDEMKIDKLRKLRRADNTTKA